VFKECEVFVLRPDNATEINSAEVQQICLDNGIKTRLLSPGHQFQNATAEKSIRDVWIMTKTALPLSNVPKKLQDELILPANEGVKIATIVENIVTSAHFLPFGRLLYIAILPMTLEVIRTFQWRNICHGMDAE
jgi:hypothetical protein